MTAPLFVDSNVLIYAHHTSAGDRHAVAKRLIANPWRTRCGILSNQVLQEFYVNVTRKIAAPLAHAEARNVVRRYGAWPVVALTVGDIAEASELEERRRLQQSAIGAAIHLHPERPTYELLAALFPGDDAP